MQDQRGGGVPPKARTPESAGFMAVPDAIDLYAAQRRAAMHLPEPAKPVCPKSGPLKDDPPRVSVQQVLAERSASKEITLAVRRGDLTLYSPRTGAAVSPLISPSDVEFLSALVRVDEVVALAAPWGRATAAIASEDTSTEERSTAEPRVEHAETAKPPVVEAPSPPVAEVIEPEALSATRRKPLSRAEVQDEAILDAVRELGHDPKKLPAFRGGRNGGVKATVKRVVEAGSAHLFQSKSRVFDKAWERLRARGEILDERAARQRNPVCP